MGISFKIKNCKSNQAKATNCIVAQNLIKAD